jgi:hypothetical protein
MNEHEVLDFFGRYRDAFNALDGDAVADLWHTPSSIADSETGLDGKRVARVTLWNEDAPKRKNMRALCDVYMLNDYARAEFEFEHLLELGANHAFVNVWWKLWRKDGSLLQEFRTAYQLLRTAKGLRVLMATAYEEDVASLKLAALER